MNRSSALSASLMAASTMLASPVSHAADPVATFARISGHAIVSKGAQYVEAQEGMPLLEGDRLMVMDGGSATIVFSDDCQYQVADNEVLTIGATSTCAGGEAGSYRVDSGSAVASDATAAAGGQTLTPAAAQAAIGPGTGAFIAAGVVGAVGIAAIASSGGDGNDDRPALSP